MGNEKWSMLRTVLAWTLAIGGSLATAASVAAAETELSIVVTNCERMPISFPFEGGGCSPAIGAVIVVTDSAGGLIGTCIAERMGDRIAACSVSVAKGATVTVTEDVTSLPPGFAPTDRSQVFEVPFETDDGVSGGPVFVNLPTGAGDSVPLSPEVPVNASGIALPAPTMIGAPGDVWTIYVGDDHFWWSMSHYSHISLPHPNYAKAPLGVWLVVEIALGTNDSWNMSGFPYESFALEDGYGNVFLPDFDATSAYCQEYCSRHIENQDFGGYVGARLDQALVFDIPPMETMNEQSSQALSLRTVDGRILVIMK